MATCAGEWPRDDVWSDANLLCILLDTSVYLVRHHSVHSLTAQLCTLLAEDLYIVGPGVGPGVRASPSPPPAATPLIALTVGTYTGLGMIVKHTRN